ncbi:MAG: thioredoxin family protein [Opitutales bacterium]|nr:thioredoxin family protein [Opitutales bacterium]MCH8540666.1 thioredoxin family protein [Opitutales bacterium]
MKCIKILGESKSECQPLHQLVVKELERLELEESFEVKWVNDANSIVSFGVMMTPGLVINEDVKSCGYLPERNDLRRWIESEIEVAR